MKMLELNVIFVTNWQKSQSNRKLCQVQPKILVNQKQKEEFQKGIYKRKS